MRSVGFSDTLFVRLKYVEQFGVAPGAPIGQYTFRGNSLFDPNYTAGGHQPMYMDQYAYIYNKYRVMASSIRVDTVNGSNASAIYQIVFPNTDIVTATSIPLVLEQTSAYAPRIIPTSQQGPEGRVKMYCSTRRACGISRAELGDDTYSSTMGASPLNIWYWNLVWGSTDASSSVTVAVIVKIIYYVQFYDRVPASQS